MEMTPPLGDDLVLTAARFAALGSTQRLQVLRIIVRAGPTGLSIGVLGRRSGVGGSTLTHHLGILVAAGLVHRQRQGRSMICTAIAQDAIQDLSRFLTTECCAGVQAPCPDHPRIRSVTPLV